MTSLRNISSTFMILLALAAAHPLLSKNDAEDCEAFPASCNDILGTVADDESPGLSLLQRTATAVARNHKNDALEKPMTKTMSKPMEVAAPSYGWTPVFPNPAYLSWTQLIVITLVYGYVLYVGSNMLGDGSELLCFFGSVAGIVGSVIVPILGAVPDGAMVLFSGLGADAQKSVSTGVGALAGSTVMLLTFPWFIVNMCGSVPLKDDGTADYKRNQEPTTLFASGVTFGKSVSTNAMIMVVTSLSFLIIQIPAYFKDHPGLPIPVQAKFENIFSLATLIVSIVFFCLYIGLMYMNGNEDTRLKILIENIKAKKVSLATVLQHMKAEEVEQNLPKILRCFYHQYDTNKDNSLSEAEFTFLLTDLGESLSPDQAKQQFCRVDAQKDGVVGFNEFCQFASTYDGQQIPKKKVGKMPTYEEDDEDEEVLPEDLADQPIEVQQRHVFMRSMFLMGLGTVLVLAFSDPAVDVFTEWGNRLGINSFYIGFLLAPFASNASELLVAYGYAKARTAKKITMSFESLVGAACMNNTFVLAVFMALVYFKSLAWTFKAETFAILIIQWIMAAIILSSNTQRKCMGFAILALYPLSLVIVYTLENVAGWD